VPDFRILPQHCWATVYGDFHHWVSSGNLTWLESLSPEYYQWDNNDSDNIRYRTWWLSIFIIYVNKILSLRYCINVRCFNILSMFNGIIITVQWEITVNGKIHRRNSNARALSAYSLALSSSKVLLALDLSHVSQCESCGFEPIVTIVQSSSQVTTFKL